MKVTALLLPFFLLQYELSKICCRAYISPLERVERKTEPSLCACALVLSGRARCAAGRSNRINYCAANISLGELLPKNNNNNNNKQLLLRTTHSVRSGRCLFADCSLVKNEKSESMITGKCLQPSSRILINQ